MGNASDRDKSVEEHGRRRKEKNEGKHAHDRRVYPRDNTPDIGVLPEGVTKRFLEEEESDVFVPPEGRIPMGVLRSYTGITPEPSGVILDYLYHRDLHNNRRRPPFPDWNTWDTAPFNPMTMRHPDLRTTDPALLSLLEQRMPNSLGIEMHPKDVETFLREKSFAGGILDGPQIEYDAHGYLLSFTNWHNNLKHGRRFTRIGRMWKDEEYAHGAHTGPITFRYPGGEKFFTATPVANDLGMGSLVEIFGYYPNKAKMFKGLISHKKFTGEFKFYAPNGTRVRAVTFDKDGFDIRGDDHHLVAHSPKEHVDKKALYGYRDQNVSKATEDEKLRSLILELLYGPNIRNKKPVGH